MSAKTRADVAYLTSMDVPYAVAYAVVTKGRLAERQLERACRRGDARAQAKALEVLATLKAMLFAGRGVGAVS